ncbi:vWA domain-containing protein [Lacinutrix jangbogonensis]|uniref:vWA domain-containing protein n=1 Tax=Lacinutrix jangbogonensis TaxID=1469557 RepID=UPI00053E8468|nr:VWA domain-containing protein [Lacinutrix jangbogonensis]
MPENFHIAYVYVALLVPLPIFIYWLLPAIKNRTSALVYPYFQRTAEVSKNKPQKAAYVKKKSWFSFLILYTIWLLLLTALSSPELVGKPEKTIKTSRNFLILADLSFSMANKDWIVDRKRTTRWNAVKGIMKDFITERKSDKMGLLFFASSAYIQVPFTTDLEVVQTMMDEADVGMAGQSTNMGKAIIKGMDMFERDTIPTKVMLLLTDGVDAGISISPLDAAAIAKENDVIIYTIGIGNPGSNSSDLDERTLIEIAKRTNGKYFRAKDSEALENIYKALELLQPVEYEEERYVSKTLLYYYPLGLALILSFIAVTVNTILQIIKRIRNRQ